MVRPLARRRLLSATVSDDTSILCNRNLGTGISCSDGSPIKLKPAPSEFLSCATSCAIDPPEKSTSTADVRGFAADVATVAAGSAALTALSARQAMGKRTRRERRFMGKSGIIFNGKPDGK